MAKIAIVVIPFWGHVNVTLSVGQELIARGHNVRWFLPTRLNGLVIPDGGDIVYTNTNRQSEVDELIGKLEACRSKPAFEGVKYVMEEVLVPLAEAMFDKLNDLIAMYLPDLILHDEQTYAGAFCAYQNGIPYVTTHPAPSGIFETSGLENIREWYFNCLMQLQTKLGIRSRKLLYISAELGLAFSPRDFANTENLLPQQKFVGPCTDVARTCSETFDTSLLANGNKKNILVSIGTLLSGEASNFFRLAADEFADTPYTIVVTTEPEILENWPANFIVQKRIPYSGVLKHIDVIITHGGANTVCESIANGIPLIVIPMAYDQYYVGDQVEINKIGVRLRYKRLKPGILLKACNTLLAENNEYKQNVLRFSEVYKNAGGAKKACDLIGSHFFAQNKHNFIKKENTQKTL
ncbi:MAG: hypothetical protein JXB34_06850 [Bacteroidales bacterium]|nr:hypothetical protein [Bacteroidales bacterium]